MSATNTRVGSVAVAMLVGLNAALLAGCAVTDGPYPYSTDVHIGLDYYDPWFDDYGDHARWGPGYRVAPPRWAVPRPDLDLGHRPPPGYRPPPRGRPIPSLPSRPHPPGPRERR